MSPPTPHRDPKPPSRKRCSRSLCCRQQQRPPDHLPSSTRERPTGVGVPAACEGACPASGYRKTWATSSWLDNAELGGNVAAGAAEAASGATTRGQKRRIPHRTPHLYHLRNPKVRTDDLPRPVEDPSKSWKRRPFGSPSPPARSQNWTSPTFFGGVDTKECSRAATPPSPTDVSHPHAPHAPHPRPE